MSATETSPSGEGESGSGVRSGLEELRPDIERALAEATGFSADCPERLADAIRYALLAPGKRLRPALVLMAAEASGGTLEAAMPAAVAVEMIHAYSLIHDDLPAMDDDDRRRGRPTVHIRFDEATAILAGDALQAEAFRHLATRIAEPRLAAEAVAVLAAAAGASALVGGQAEDLAAESGGEQTLQRLESIHRRKTGALIAASVDLGAVLGDAPESTRGTLRNYAKALGLAFQVVDDLLDLTADEAAMGKRVGKDADRGKLTYPGLLGVEGARRKAQQLIESALSEAALLGDNAWRLQGLAHYVLERTH